MVVETHNGLREPKQIQATRVLVRNQFNEPVVLVTEQFAGGIEVLVAGDAGFAEAVGQLGAVSFPVTRATMPPAPRVIV